MLDRGGLIVLAMVLALALTPATGHAIPVEIDPGAYAYSYSVDGGSLITGRVTLDLAPGVHEIETGARVDLPGDASSAFYFTVGEAGDVTSVTNPLSGAPSRAATGSGSRLVFRQVTVTIDPGRLPGDYVLQGGEPAMTGRQSIVLAPDLVYRLEEAILAGVDENPAALFFVLDGDGRVTTVRYASGIESAAAVGHESTLLLGH